MTGLILYALMFISSGTVPQAAGPRAREDWSLPCAQVAQQSGPEAQEVSDANPPVKITHGPVVEHVTDTTAQIAWSTNVNAGTLLRYGIDANHLDQSATMPWGGLTHRVELKLLQPGTTYFFKAESAQGQGTGTRAEAAPASFQTRPAGQNN